MQSRPIPNQAPSRSQLPEQVFGSHKRALGTLPTRRSAYSKSVIPCCLSYWRHANLSCDPENHGTRSITLMNDRSARSIHGAFLKHRYRAIVVAGVMVAIVGLLDHENGREWHVTPLYLLPLGLVVWFAGRRWGIFFSLLIAAVWLAAAELAVGPEYSHPVLPVWNAVMFLMIFIFITLVLSRLRDVTETLEQRVELRTAQLMEEMMKRTAAEQGWLRAERLAVVGSMAAQMAHEVRNPLCSISLNLEMLTKELEELTTGVSSSAVEANALITQIETEFGHINQVVHDYLGFARLPKVVPCPHSLHAFLDESLALLSTEMDAAGVRLVKDYHPSITTAKIDPARMWQVLLNLIRNAREAMPQGGEVRIRTFPEGKGIGISVSDTGCGISAENMSKLFSPFFTTKATGTGLGLPLTNQIVVEHGGRLECESTPLIGTTFTISLPLSPVSCKPLPLKHESTETKPSHPHELHFAHSPS